MLPAVTVNETAYDLLNRLSAAMLPPELQSVPLKQRLPALEERAADSAHLFAAAAGKAQATPDGIDHARPQRPRRHLHQ